MIRGSSLRRLLLELETGAPPPVDKEPNVDGSLAYNDRVYIGKMPAVDVDSEIAGGEAGESAHHAALKLIVRRTRAYSFSNGERNEFANAQRRSHRKGHRACRSDSVDIERNSNANHTTSFSAASRSRLPTGSTVPTMSLEKRVAKMEDAELTLILRDAIGDMPSDAVRALVASIFDAFRDRGESSEDAAEGAETPLDRIEQGDRQAVAALVSYAGNNTGLLKESLALFEDEHPAQLPSLPQILNGSSE